MCRTVSMLLVAPLMASVSCSATVSPVGRPPSPSMFEMTQSGATSPAGMGHGPGEDAHWIQADDFFVANQPYTSSWIWMYLGKMKQPPSAQTKNEALFFMVLDGSDQWSANFYRTRPAVQADLAMGNLLICFEGNKQSDVCQGPTDKNNARQGRWWMARVTDVSDMFKGYVTLSGSYHCAPSALRALVQ